MALDEDLEFQRLTALVRQFGWEVARTEVQDGNLVMVLKKPRTPVAPQAGGGDAPTTGIPT